MTDSGFRIKDFVERLTPSAKPIQKSDRDIDLNPKMLLPQRRGDAEPRPQGKTSNGMKNLFSGVNGVALHG